MPPRADPNSTYSYVKLAPETRKGLIEMGDEIGIQGVANIVRYLVTAHRDGLLMIVNRAAKESLMGAAEERLMTRVERKAKEIVRTELWAEGYRSDPYEH